MRMIRERDSRTFYTQCALVKRHAHTVELHSHCARTGQTVVESYLASDIVLKANDN